ncbi:long chain base biosynthesis protein 2a-like [Phoenix dactylifera]|uniref:Pectin acetylesterase n=1 Tax=Phoenix dactylifera TaxID=42345 RepID=A0A8B9AJG0_PHODC|nr:long chain base biosynthesis protein 2a-like [Phoenix dactylifera]
MDNHLGEQVSEILRVHVESAVVDDGGGGYHGHRPRERRDFYNWNKVKVRYCDGSSFTGDVKRVNPNRGSGATVRVFQHNNPSHLEEVLREQIAEGQPRTHRPWKKIIVIVEGIYSMEGELCKLPEIIAVCKKYKNMWNLIIYTYLDEAHSIGAVGKSGRGVCELLGVDPADVDIMMGTFTKSFGSCGGYTAASKEIIQYLKYTCPAHLYATSMSPPAVQQVISAIKIILGEDGSNRGAQKLARIRENSNFFRSELQKMGFEVLGDNDSPVMPIMLYNPAKIPAFSRECLRQNVSMTSYLNSLLCFRTQFLNALAGFGSSSSTGMFINSCYAHCQSEMQETWLSSNSPVLEKIIDVLPE